MPDYPKLSEMGVMHPDQIDTFTINGMETYDVLHIVYKRQSGSILPITRTYKFPRVQKDYKTADGGTETRLATDPVLREAHDELKQLCDMRKHKRTVTESILEELRLLEEDIALRSACIRKLAEKI